MTSNVSQNYPYTSESEADRAATVQRLLSERDGLAATIEAGATPLDAQDRWWVWKCPTKGCDGPVAHLWIRGRQARPLRRVRRDLRKDLPALSPRTDGYGPSPQSLERRESVDSLCRRLAPRSTHGESPARPGRCHGHRRFGDRLRFRLRPVRARGWVLPDRSPRDERARVRWGVAVRRRGICRERAGLAGDRAAYRVAECPSLAVLGGAGAVAVRCPVPAARRDGASPDRRGLRASRSGTSVDSAIPMRGAIGWARSCRRSSPGHWRRSPG